MVETGRNFSQEANFLREAYHKICKDLRGGNTLDLNNPLLHNAPSSQHHLDLQERQILTETRQVNRDLFSQRLILTEEFLQGVKKTHFAETLSQNQPSDAALASPHSNARHKNNKDRRKRKGKKRRFHREKTLSSELRKQEVPRVSDPQSMRRGMERYAKDQNMSMSRYVSQGDFGAVPRARRRGELPREFCRSKEFPTEYADALSRNRNDLRDVF